MKFFFLIQSSEYCAIVCLVVRDPRRPSNHKLVPRVFSAFKMAAWRTIENEKMRSIEHSGYYSWLK